MSFLTSNDIIRLIRGSIVEDYDVRRLHNGNFNLFVKFRNAELKVELSVLTSDLKEVLRMASA